MMVEIRYDPDGMGIGLFTEDNECIGYYNGEDHEITSVQSLIERLLNHCGYDYSITVERDDYSVL